MKKKKIIYIFISITVIIVILVLLGVLVYAYSGENKEIQLHEKTETGGTDIGLNTEDENKELIRSKLGIIKNRMKIKDIILKGDNYFQNEQLTLAVIQYKIALTKNPEDYKMIEKIGDIYFEMKKFEEAKNYYLKLLNVVGFDSNKYILSLIYSKDITKKTNSDLVKNDIKQNIKDTEKAFFYTNAIYCIEDFHTCKKNFDEKIIMEKDNIKSVELNEIKNVLQTYTDFGLVNLYYKNTLIIGSFMKLKLYPISIFLGKNLLKEKEDYKAVIQIIAQSYFDLGNYKTAYIYLKKYFELNSTDSKAAYMLGIINLKLNDYILSNIFFNKALYLGYNDTINVRRKIAYNYYMLNDYDKMYKTFDDIINTEKKITTDDINIMINHSIETNKNDKTYEWTKKGLKLFPKEPLFYAYMGKQELDKGEITNATVYLKRGLELDVNNQLLNYISGLLKVKENNEDEAKIYFEKAYNSNKNTTLAKEIKKELDNL